MQTNGQSPPTMYQVPTFNPATMTQPQPPPLHPGGGTHGHGGYGDFQVSSPQAPFTHNPQEFSPHPQMNMYTTQKVQQEQLPQEQLQLQEELQQQLHQKQLEPQEHLQPPWIISCNRTERLQPQSFPYQPQSFHHQPQPLVQQPLQPQFLPNQPQSLPTEQQTLSQQLQSLPTEQQTLSQQLQSLPTEPQYLSQQPQSLPIEPQSLPQQAQSIPQQPQLLTEQPQFLPQQPQSLPKPFESLPEQPQSPPQQPQALPQQPQSLPQQPQSLPQQPQSLSEQSESLPQQQQSLPQQPQSLPEQPELITEQPQSLPQQPQSLPEQLQSLPQQPQSLPQEPESLPGQLQSLPKQSESPPQQLQSQPKQSESPPQRLQSLPKQSESPPQQPQSLPMQQELSGQLQSLSVQPKEIQIKNEHQALQQSQRPQSQIQTPKSLAQSSQPPHSLVNSDPRVPTPFSFENYQVMNDRDHDHNREQRQGNPDRDRYAREFAMFQRGYYHGYPPYQYPYQYPYMHMPPQHFGPPAAHQVLPDRESMNNFEINWKYYLEHPHLYEQLRLEDPSKYGKLNDYYRVCGEYLKLPPILPSIKREVYQVPSSRASIHSRQSSEATSNVNQFHQLDDYPRSESRQGLDDSSSIPYPDPEAPQRYIPTYSSNLEDSSLHHQPQSEQRMTPVKFTSAHVNATFGATGIMVKTDANSPLEGQSASVDIMSLQSIFSESVEDFQNFPGPLIPGRTHKGEVIQFCQAKVQAAQRTDSIVDVESYCLLWDLLILLLRQKNSIDGSDIAELLLRDREVQTPYQNGTHQKDTEAADISVKHDKSVISNLELEKGVTMKFRDYLTFGHKKEGLEYAMKHGLWGHALFLASKMDERSYSNVMLRFANGLAVNDPLQTLYQLMSGRQPIAVKECADKNWGDWRPHLAMILSNPSGKEDLDRRSILTLGDTLLKKGLLYASHFCYLMANIEFGAYTNPSAKLVLLSTDRTLGFDEFATNEAIQCTEIFEYIQKLSNPDYAMMSLQYFKFVYALRLMDCGLSSQALHYFEEISRTATKNFYFVIGDLLSSSDFMRQVLELGNCLKYLDPMYSTREGEVADMGDPEWLTALREVMAAQETRDNDTAHTTQAYDDIGHEEADSAGILNDAKDTESNYTDNYEGQEPIMMRPVAEEEVEIQPEVSANELDPPPMSIPLMNPSTIPSGNLDFQPIASHSSSGQSSPHVPPPPLPTFTTSFPLPSSNEPNYFSNVSHQKVSPPHPEVSPLNSEASVPKPTPIPAKKTEEKKENNKKSDQGPGMFGRLLGRFIKPPNQAHLPDDSDQGIVWDEEKKKWIDKNADPEEEAAASSAPPSDMELSRNTSLADMGSDNLFPGGPLSAPTPLAPPGSFGPGPLGPPSLASAPPPPGGNKFAGGLAKKRGRAGRIDVFKNSQAAPTNTNAQHSGSNFIPQGMPGNFY